MPRANKDKDGKRINTYSYYKSNAVGGTAERSKRRASGARSWRGVLQFKRRYSLSRILLIVCLVGAVVYLMSAETRPIIRLSKNGEYSKGADVYQRAAQKIISSSLFNRSKLLFNYQDVRSRLMAQFPEIEQLEVTFDLVGRRPVVRIITRQPIFLYQTTGQTWLIDSRGVALGEGRELDESQTGSMTTIIDENNAKGEVGKTLIAPGQVNFIVDVIKYLDKQQVIVENIYIPATPKEIDLNVVGEGWRYKLSTDESPAMQAGVIIATRRTLATEKLSPTEYVDIRSGEKVYWK